MTTRTPIVDTAAAARTGNLVVGAIVLLTMFAPMIAIFVYGVTLTESREVAAGEVTVGLAVVLRATARRLLRGASTGIMRTTASALGRASARTFTRRLVKFTGRLFFGSLVKEATETEDADAAQAPASALSKIVAVAIGCLALCASFFGVLWVVDAPAESSITARYGLSAIEIALLAGLPLLAYAGLHQLLGRVFGVRTRYRTEFDGLLLQAYFTGAGSFLPLTTDVDFDGTERGRRLMTMSSILGMFTLHVLLVWIGTAVDSEALQFLGAMFLVYCFVYCFPIKPLEGHYIWAHSKFQWLLVTLPVLVSFITLLPPSFGEIL